MKCQEVTRCIRDLLRENIPEGLNVRMEVEDRLEPFEVDSRSILVRSLRRAIRDITKRAAILTRKTGSSDIVLLRKVAEAIVAYGPGDPRSEHTVNEYIDIAEYLMSIRVYERVLEVLSRYKG
jgi:LysW-gamma-L-lysine carboxypeptidase